VKPRPSERREGHLKSLKGKTDFLPTLEGSPLVWRYIPLHLQLKASF